MLGREPWIVTMSPDSGTAWLPLKLMRNHPNMPVWIQKNHHVVMINYFIRPRFNRFSPTTKQ
jgi:hypothetical protein